MDSKARKTNEILVCVSGLAGVESNLELTGRSTFPFYFKSQFESHTANNLVKIMIRL